MAGRRVTEWVVEVRWNGRGRKVSIERCRLETTAEALAWEYRDEGHDARVRCVIHTRAGRLTMDKTTDADVAFFYEHAGWSHTPGTETPEEGRLRGARKLAKAERWLSRQNGHTVEWDAEPDPDYSGIDHNGPLFCCLVCVPGLVGQSLGNIDLGPDCNLCDPYTRVVVAELALELMER
jgi:hypothetical protein